MDSSPMEADAACSMEHVAMWIVDKKKKQIR